MSSPAVLFDLDGTLADTVPLIADHIAASVTRFSVATEPDAVVPFIGRPLEVALAELSGIAIDDPRIEQMATSYLASWQGAINERGHELILPGVHHMLLRLRDAGFAIGVVTAKSTAEATQLLDVIGVRDDIDVVIGTDLVDRGKPAPDSAWMALELMGADAAGTWYVGDATSDIHMALAAGMRPMGITSGASPRASLLEAGAEVVVDDATEVADQVLAAR